MPGSKLVKVVQAEYQAQTASLGKQSTDPVAITKLFQPQIEWYRERLQANICETKKSGKFDLTIGHYAKMVTNLVCHLLSFFTVPNVLTPEARPKALQMKCLRRICRALAKEGQLF